MRTVVVGASSGLGRSIAIGLGQRGATVALMARRQDRLVDAAKEAGTGSLAIVCDVTDDLVVPGRHRRGGRRPRAASTPWSTPPGSGPWPGWSTSDADTWRRRSTPTSSGPPLVTAAAIPHLTASRGVAAYLSSVNGIADPCPGPGSVPTPRARPPSTPWSRPGGASTPGVGFTQVIVGDCAGGEGASMTGFANDWDWDLAVEIHPIWSARNT